MKKIKSFITYSLVGVNILTLGLGSIALAQTIGKVPVNLPPGAPTTVGGLVNLLRAVVQWIYIIFFIVAVAVIIFAAFTYLTAAGSQEKIDKAKTMIIYAAVALAVALLAVGFETIIGTFLGSPAA